MLPPPDASAQLVQLREAEPLRILDEHHRRVRHVDADLDHRGGKQHLDFPRAEGRHHPFFFRPVELAVQQSELRPRQKLLQPVELGLHRFRLDLLRLLDQRVDDIGLPPLPDLFEKKRPEFIELLRRPALGQDRLAARRQLVENGTSRSP